MRPPAPGAVATGAASNLLRSRSTTCFVLRAPGCNSFARVPHRENENAQLPVDDLLTWFQLDRLVFNIRTGAYYYY